MAEETTVEEADPALLPVPVTPAAAHAPVRADRELPALVRAAGGPAAFVWDEVFAGEIRNPHTRVAYERAVRRFLAWCREHGIEDLRRVAPGDVGRYLDDLDTSIPTKKLHLAAIR